MPFPTPTTRTNNKLLKLIIIVILSLHVFLLISNIQFFTSYNRQQKERGSIVVSVDPIQRLVDVKDETVMEEENRNSRVVQENVNLDGSLVSTQEEENIEKIKIAYAVSLTKCAEYAPEGAAILMHSIRLASYPHISNSKYSFDMYVFAHPTTSDCIQPFEKLGYKVLLKETPIEIKDIKGQFLREHVGQSGCCGEKEFLKLYSYTLMDYPVVVHLDLDSLILQPFDNLFDVMIFGNHTTSSRNIPVMHNYPLPPKVDAFFTRDYNMVNAGHKHPGIQGGFLVVRPNLDYFEEYRQIILEGNFKQGGGWGGQWGGYFGAQQIQGICSYFYDAIHPNTAVELNRCIYNQMADNPKQSLKKGQTEKCRDGHDTCEDCRETDISLIKSAHFTICQKPWICPYSLSRLCKELHTKWFSIREDFEKSFDIKVDGLAKKKSVFKGYCKGGGQSNYIPIAIDRL